MNDILELLIYPFKKLLVLASTCKIDNISIAALALSALLLVLILSIIFGVVNNE